MKVSCKRAEEHIATEKILRLLYVTQEKEVYREDTLPACESALHTYRGLFLPHLDVLPLRLSEVIPDLLVAGRSKDSFDLTDC